MSCEAGRSGKRRRVHLLDTLSLAFRGFAEFSKTA